MEYKRVTAENIGSEHICCALSGPECQSKKDWMVEQMKHGLTFLKLDERGKVFIEYIPAEYAFAPVDAPNYFYVNCFWVSGKFQKQGHAKELLGRCIEDAKAQDKDGLVILSAKKKMPFLSDPGYLKHAGFEVADETEPFYVLFYLPLKKNAAVPKFKHRLGEIEDKGYVLYYSDQCPFAKKYGALIEEVAKKKGVSFERRQLSTYQQAQAAPTPFTSYSLFYDGKLLTNEIQSEKKFEKMIDERN